MTVFLVTLVMMFFGGGTGDDDYVGGSGTDTADFSALTVDLAADLGKGKAQSSASGSDTMSSIENIISGEGDDILIGSDRENVLEGGKGDDTLAGGGGDDVLVGGEGTDTATYMSATETVTIDLGLGTASGNEVGDDALSGIENVIGGSGDDFIYGDTGNNVLEGGSGKDELIGGGGDDIPLKVAKGTIFMWHHQGTLLSKLAGAPIN